MLFKQAENIAKLQSKKARLKILNRKVMQPELNKELREVFYGELYRLEADIPNLEKVELSLEEMVNCFKKDSVGSIEDGHNVRMGNTLRSYVDELEVLYDETAKKIRNIEYNERAYMKSMSGLQSFVKGTVGKIFKTAAAPLITGGSTLAILNSYGLEPYYSVPIGATVSGVVLGAQEGIKKVVSLIFSTKTVENAEQKKLMAYQKQKDDLREKERLKASQIGDRMFNDGVSAYHDYKGYKLQQLEEARKDKGQTQLDKDSAKRIDTSKIGKTFEEIQKNYICEKRSYPTQTQQYKNEKKVLDEFDKKLEKENKEKFGKVYEETAINEVME
jgi:hypothetical protein